MKFYLLAFFVAAVAAAPMPLDDDNQAVELIVNGLPEGQALELGDVVDIKLKEHVQGEVAATSDLLHPFTAVGIAEAAAVAAAAEAAAAAFEAAAEAPAVAPTQVEFVGQSESAYLPISVGPAILPEVPSVDVPSPVVLPEPIAPESLPSPVVLPSPVLPVVVVPEPVATQPETPVAPEISQVITAPIVPVVPEVSGVITAPVAPVVPEVSDVITAPVLPEPAPQLSNEVYNDGIVQVQVNGQEAGVFSTLQSWFNLVVNYLSNGVQTSHQIV